MTLAWTQMRPGEVTTHAPQQFYSGDTWEIHASCSDGDGNLIDLEFAALTWRLADQAGAVLLTLTVGDGIALVESTSGDLVKGVCLITVTPTQSAEIEPGFYSDSLVVETGGKVLTQFSGRIEVLAPVGTPVSGG
jgi:hypothetical protein